MGKRSVDDYDPGNDVHPLNISFSNHLWISRGMKPDDARFLLDKRSGIDDSEFKEKVVKRLDNQPLALASAAVFVKEDS